MERHRPTTGLDTNIPHGVYAAVPTRADGNATDRSTLTVVMVFLTGNNGCVAQATEHVGINVRQEEGQTNDAASHQHVPATTDTCCPMGIIAS